MRESEATQVLILGNMLKPRWDENKTPLKAQLEETDGGKIADLLVNLWGPWM